jgi:peptidoglycan-associated lipoprotein
MQRMLLVLLVAGLVMGCGRSKKGADDSAVAGDGFDVDAADIAALEDGTKSAYDLPAATGNARFGEPGSGILPPAIDAEAKMVLRDIHFAYDSSTILPNDAGVLQQIAAFLNKYPEVVIQVEGHCDERGTEEYNMALGSRRANAAREFVNKLGVDANRVHVISYGEMRPAAPGHDEGAWAQNRRDHFLAGLAGK